MPEQQINVSPAFATAPQNPNVPPTNSIAPDPTPQPPQSAPVSQHVAPPAAGPVSPQPAPTTPASGSQAAAVPPPVPSVDQWYAAQQMQQQMQQLQQQNAALQQQVQTQDTTIQNLLQSQQDYDALKQAAATNSLDFGELTTIDPDDARKIGAGVMKAVSAQFEPLRKQLAEQQQYLQKSNQWQEDRFRQQRAQDTLNRIVAKHPDFVALQSDPNYLNYVRQRDGYSYQTRDARAAMEFANGNADYINNMIDQYKASRPDPGNLTSVAPVQTAAAPVAPTPPPQAVPTLKELNDMMQMRQITPDQYRALVQQSRAAYNTQG